MPNQQIFCNVPWFSFHIYHDGSFAYCCSAVPHKGYDASQHPEYNIRTMSIREWYSSQAMQNIRSKMLGDDPLPGCKACYLEEQNHAQSYRMSNNWRSMIFTKSAFYPSYVQSPHRAVFDAVDSGGRYLGVPVDLHVDLGNECNLACKFCAPEVSSKIATNYKVWGLMEKSKPSIINWTSDDGVWSRFCHELLDFKNLRSVHFMGGEPTMTPRLEQFLDFFIKHGKTDFAISFVTNGTHYVPELVAKMKKFSRADIDISMESILDNNYYIRQGLKKQRYLANVNSFLADRDQQFHVCLKPVISLLTAPTFPELISWFLDNNILTESNLCHRPAYLRVEVLPMEVRERYWSKFETTLERLDRIIGDKNKDMVHNRLADENAINLYSELKSVYSMLRNPEPENAHELRQELVYWLSKWDTIYNQDARDYYPEWTGFLNQYGYKQVDKD